MSKHMLAAGTFLAGMLAGALVLAAAQSHLLKSPANVTSVSDESKLAVGQGAPATSAADLPDADTRWSQLDDALNRLHSRVATLERQLAALTGDITVEDNQPQPDATSTGLDQATLQAAGLDPVQAAEILRRQSRLEMQRLELRDQASREGWSNSDRFFAALRELNGDAGSLREEIGDAAYDRFLYLTGQPNRVVIDSVINDSPAQLAGLQAGDVVINYADGRIFSWVDLRDATRAGQRGEYVIMRVQRDGELFELNVPRGPLGVRMDMEQLEPGTES